MIYLIGSLRNPEVPRVGKLLRAAGHEVFDDWYAAGEIADDSWQEYETARGNGYDVALHGYAASHVFDFDHSHLRRAGAGVLLLPAGKSAHLELGWLLGQGKPGFVLFPGCWPDRWDVMYRFATGVHRDIESLLIDLKLI